MSRYYKNNFPSAHTTEDIFDSSSKKLTNAVSLEIATISSRLLAILDKNAISDISDCSIYTGKAGFAYIYFRLSIKNEAYYSKWAHWTEESLRNLKGRDVTFLCGDIGPLCMGAILRNKQGRIEECTEIITTILSFTGSVLKKDVDMPSELLYGRVGYLFGLLFIQKNIPNLSTPLPIARVAKSVITAGLTGSNPPLMWNWHGKEYLGAAHGVAGILYLLLEVKDFLTPDDLLLIKQTLDYLLLIRFRSGNIPSSRGSSDDRLVHWCHGAPGFVQVLLKAHEVWKENIYFEAAEMCGEVIWERGLLKKGYGICHGVAGNAYTFLALFQATHNQLHLSRAVNFARWCGSYDNYQVHKPDRPYSLFEGLAGTVYFLNDIQDPLNALFPAYSISPFQPFNTNISK